MEVLIMRLLRLFIRTTSIAHLKWMATTLGWLTASVYGLVLFITLYLHGLELAAAAGYGSAMEAMQPEMEIAVTLAQQATSLLRFETCGDDR